MRSLWIRILSSLLALSASLSLPMALAATGEPVKIDFAIEVVKLSAKNLYDLDPKTKESSLPVLSRMKYLEIKKSWKECAALGAKVASANPEIAGWVAASWLRCELKNTETAKSKTSLNKPIDWLRKKKSLMSDGPWKTTLWADFVTANLIVFETSRSSARVDELLNSEETLTKETRAVLLGYAGEFADKKKDRQQALYLFEQSLALRDNRDIRAKLDNVKSSLNLKYSTSSAPIEGTLDNEGAEGALEERMNKELKSGETLNGLKTAVLIQTDYAGSRVARRLKDKPFEIYQELIANVPKDEKDEKSFQELERVGSIRLAEWAQTLHRRSNYQQALIFSERALKDLYQTSQSTILYSIAGRSAHFVGQYDRALMHFAKLIEFHAGTDESVEAMMRSGLINLRLKNFSTAQGHFEKLLAQKRDRFDLQGRYWLVRTLENTDKDRFAIEAKSLVDRYPFSYYGLRLNAEMNKGEYSLPQGPQALPNESGEIWLIGEQVKAFARFKVLTKAGWLLEAQSEVAGLPASKNPYLSFHIAKFMSEANQYPAAIRALNDAMDIENSLRSSESLALVYPKNYSTWIEAESKKYSLNPVLVRSLIRQESAFGIRALSVSNAQGLMQLIPGTAQEVARRLGMKKLEFPEDVFRPEVNIPLGTFYISQMIDQFNGNVPFGLAAYNAGPTKMRIFTEAREEMRAARDKPSSSPLDEIWFDELPWSETSFYVKAILRNSLLYKLIDAAKIDWTQVLWQDLHGKKPALK